MENTESFEQGRRGIQLIKPDQQVKIEEESKNDISYVTPKINLGGLIAYGNIVRMKEMQNSNNTAYTLNEDGETVEEKTQEFYDSGMGTFSICAETPKNTESDTPLLFKLWIGNGEILKEEAHNTIDSEQSEDFTLYFANFSKEEHSIAREELWLPLDEKFLSNIRFSIEQAEGGETN